MGPSDKGKSWQPLGGWEQGRGTAASSSEARSAGKWRRGCGGSGGTGRAETELRHTGHLPAGAGALRTGAQVRGFRGGLEGEPLPSRRPHPTAWASPSSPWLISCVAGGTQGLELFSLGTRQ